MKAIYFFLLSFSALSAAAWGNDVTAEVSATKRAFVEAYKPIRSLDLEELKQSRASGELNDPRTALPQIHTFPHNEISSLARFAESCKGTAQVSSPALRKAYVWHQFLCGKRKSLPSGFFAALPQTTMMHPSGASYAWLADRAGKPEYSDLKKFHITELLRDYSLSPWETKNLLNAENIVLSFKNVFIATANSGLFQTPTKYSVYSREDWDRFIRHRAFITSTRNDLPNCALKESNVCWLENPEYQGLKTRIILVALFLGFLCLAFLSIHGIVRRARLQKQESAKRLFTLQMLTHELRTPATALRLCTETLRRDFDALPKESQKAFLNICEELERLDRVVEASQGYLRADDKHQLIETRNEPPASINALLASILEPYEGKIRFEPLAVDCRMPLNRYWLELCVKNLVENAIHHGNPPIVVSVSLENRILTISVEDQGEVTFKSLEELATPFLKTEKSRGLGLGLAIVQKVVRSMHGELSYKESPTTFSIKLRQTT